MKRKAISTNTNTNKSKPNSTKIIEMPMMPGMPGMPPQDNIVESDFHTLISIDFPTEAMPLLDQNGSPIPNCFKQDPGYTLYKLFVGDFMDESGHGLDKIINKLQEGDLEDEVEMHITSHGGSTLENARLYNILTSLYKGRTKAYLNHGYSAGALAFLFADERIVYEHSEIMFHTWSGGAVGKRQDVIDQIKHYDVQLKKFNDKILSPYFTKKEISKMDSGKERWFGAHEMLVRGIATAIIEDGVYYTSEEYFTKYKKDGSIKASWTKKQDKIAADEKAAIEAQQKMLEELM